MDDRLKRLAYRAQRRGFKEADIVFARFSEAYLADLNPAEADDFERILELQDHDIVSWVMGRSEPTEAENSPLLEKFLAFARGGFAQPG